MGITKGSPRLLPLPPYLITSRSVGQNFSPPSTNLHPLLTPSESGVYFMVIMILQAVLPHVEEFTQTHRQR